MSLHTTEYDKKILNVLWNVLGSGTVHEIQNQLNEQGMELSYAAVLKQLQTMRTKGLLTSEKGAGPTQQADWYKPAVTYEEVYEDEDYDPSTDFERFRG